MVHHATTAAFTLSTELNLQLTAHVIYVGYLLLPRQQPFVHSWWLSFRHSLKLCSPFSVLPSLRAVFNCWCTDSFCIRSLPETVEAAAIGGVSRSLRLSSVALFSSLRDGNSDYARIAQGIRHISQTVTMWKPSSSRNHRGKRLRPEQCLQLSLLVAVGIWLVYQLGHSYRRRAVSVEGELIRRRWMDRKSLIKFASVVSGLDARGIGGGGIVARDDGAVERESRSNKGREDEGDEDDSGLFGYDDGDDRNFHPENGEGGEDSELDRSAVGGINTTGGAQHDVAGAA